ncbi:serine/threonine protein kinase [Schlesneria paludicola]|uniref:serine/threonine protein kinase n=1 Tax=Schlesneria paludicola TaxID=360056 RepID=UPI00029ACF74|nr:serine/threonine-protein kinase [Schlesneria paludicola]
MNDATRCAQCGCDVPVGFPPGVCPTCLLKQAMSPSTFNSAAERRSPSNRRWIPPSPAELAPRFPQLEIVELLGQGATGAVYKVRQLDLDRWAALKILSDEVAEDSSFAERFQREARALALLGHQHIVIVYEFGQRNGVYFLLMEYVDGVNLRQAIRAQEITTQEALAIVMQICDALQFAHEEGVIHRDIKPENILIDKRGRVKIADFGLAKLLGRSFEVPTLTGTHQVMGTPVYMSPEQMEGTRAVDHRADIFSLGVVFYELLTGELPLGRFAPPSQKYQLDVRLDDVVLRSLEKEPDRRYQKASEVRHDIDSIRTQQPVSFVPPVRSRSLMQGWQSWQVRTALLGLLLVGIVVVADLIEPNTSDPQNRILTSKGIGNQVAHEANLQHGPMMDFIQKSGQAPVHHLGGGGGGMLGARLGGDEEDFLARKRPDTKWSVMVVQFDEGNASLNSRVDGANWGFVEITESQRMTIDRILTEIHQKYLEVERQHTHRVIHEDGTQESIISDLSLDRAKLEQEFWLMVDSEFSAELQRFIRRVIPLYSDVQRQQPEIFINSLRDADGTFYQGKGSLEGELIFPFKMRDPQILGWRQVGQELHVSIKRTATGFRWNLTFKFREFVDTGEARVLPVGLRRFWNATNIPQTNFSKPPLGKAAPFWEEDSDLPLKTHNPLELDEFDDYKRRMKLDSYHEAAESIPQLESSFDGDGSAIAHPDSADLSDVLDMTDSNRGVDLGASDDVAKPVGQDNTDIGLYDDVAEPLDQIDSEKHLDKSDVSLGLVLEKLDHWILDDVDLPQFNRQIDVLLVRYPKPLDQGAVRLKAVQVIVRHVHLQHSGDFSSHIPEIYKHAMEGLKRLRDPSERSELFLILGQIAGRAPEFLENRATSARWYLKGYAELLPFQLPEAMPPLPIVEERAAAVASAQSPENSTTNEALAESGTVSELTWEQVDFEVRREILEKRRAQVEVTRGLVGRRDEYVAGIKALVVRSRQSDSPPDDQWLEKLAMSILPTMEDVTRLIESIGTDPEGSVDARQK